MKKNNKHGKIICVIPVYNEEEYIESTITGLKETNLIDEIIVVDDGSSDNTYNKASKMDVKTIKLSGNHGKGYAVKVGIDSQQFDYLVLIDGDLGETSKEIYKLINPVLNDEADVTIAKFPKTKIKGGIGLVKKLSRLGVTLYTGKNIDSVLSGQRVYKREVLNKISYIPDRFGIEVAMTILTLKNNFRIKEVNVDMKHRETLRNFKGFLHRGKQFLDILITLILMCNRR